MPEEVLDSGRHLFVAGDAGGIVVQAAASETGTYPVGSGIVMFCVALFGEHQRGKRVNPHGFRAGSPIGFMNVSVQLFTFVLPILCCDIMHFPVLFANSIVFFRK